jgi:hypothetical protein
MTPSNGDERPSIQTQLISVAIAENCRRSPSPQGADQRDREGGPGGNRKHQQGRPLFVQLVKHFIWLRPLQGQCRDRESGTSGCRADSNGFQRKSSYCNRPRHRGF